MAEVKNAFIKSKMNKDLDARLLPSGEYREGINIQVSRSEGADVGSLQNVRGNKLLIDFASLTGAPNLTTIGQFTDVTNEVIYVFLTDYTPPSNNPEAFNPTANNFVYAYNVNSNTATPLLKGAFLNFATTNLIIGVNVLENFLFFTDNRNQPRKININSAAPIPPETNPTYYTTEEQISVAKYNPFEPIQLYKETGANTGVYETAMYDRSSQNLPNGTPNPYYAANYPGDPNYLNDKFVRFSYRFKFDDNEYSLIAPFTQPAFIPDQDGYFLENATPSGNSKDENATYRSTVVDFMENKVDNILLQIPLPSKANQLNDNFKVSEIEILYKESDETTIKVIDTIDVQTADFVSNSTDIVQYNYQARKPFKTLPNADLIRVYDKVPVKAFGQEIISNRVVYSNFQDKHTPPANIEYSVNASNKSAFNVSGTNETQWDTSITEYPMHTLKQNRNYQVGIVLSDKFGRTSSVILSSVTADDVTESGSVFKGSTYYHPYKTTANNLPATWPGDSLKVLFTSEITGGGAGLYNGNTGSASYNPLGWYSYKIVVKQTEQDYYNVYLPGILNQDPGGLLDDPKDTVSYITLLNDNINKVPRDLSEVGPEQKQFRSSVQLFGRVTPDASTNIPGFNKQYYPGQSSDTVSTIGEQNDILGTTTDYSDIYQSKSNPLLARSTQGDSINPIGADIHASGNYNILLGVYETSPTLSLLDIYWETSTTGLISDLNLAINTGNQNPTGFSPITYTQSEANAIGTIITNDFWPLDLTDNPIPNSQVDINTIVDGTGANRTGIVIIKTNAGSTTPQGVIRAYDSYALQTSAYFFFNSDPNQNNFTFNFNVQDLATSASTLIDYQASLINASPQITNCPSTIAVVPGTQDIFTFTGNNGSNTGGSYTSQGLVWSLINGDPTSPITINSSTGVLQDLTGTATGSFSGTVTLTDADGGSANGALSTTCLINTTVGSEPANGAFADCKTITGGLGAISQGFYWVSDVTNAAKQSTAINNLRQPITALQLNDNLASPTEAAVTVTNSNCHTLQSQPPVITNKNNNIIYNSNQAASNLTQGTAYISVDFELEQYSAFQLSGNNIGLPASGTDWSQGPYVTWPCYLQYRPNAASPWVRATDIENNQIFFGGAQEVNYEASSVNSGFNIFSSDTTSNTINKEGVINQSTTSTPVLGNNFVNGIDTTDVMSVMTQYYAAGSPTPNYTRLFGKANRTFAIGKDQGYKQHPDKFGDYRLIVGYPWGQAQYYNGNYVGQNAAEGVVTVNLNILNPSSTNVRCPETTSVFYNGNRYKITVKYGDFYYPKDYPTCSSSSPTFFEYKVSSSGDSASINSLKNSTPSVSVFAKEWHCKYVTQFYTDSALSTKWTPTSQSSGKWHTYTPAFSNTKTGRDGTWNSWVKGEGQPITNNFAYTDQDRRWAAQFNATGEKLTRTATPSETGQ
tara:strand:+ start:6691 stop:10995 length:4305 start_codon:yes stop_codon:yes gene_type:complete